MKKILFLFLSALMFMTSLPTVAQDARQRKPETIVQDVLALMPIQKAHGKRINNHRAPFLQQIACQCGMMLPIL